MTQRGGSTVRRLLLVALILSLSPVALAQPTEVVRTTEKKPFTVMLENGFGTPSGIFGAGVQHHFTPEWAGYVGGGLGFTGVQLGLQARYSIGLGSRGSHSLVLGLGPSIGFRSESMGFHIEHRAEDTVDPDKLFFTTWLDAEIAWELRAHIGITVRVVLGVGIRLADNQGDLCRRDDDDEGDDCGGIDQLMVGSYAAALPLLPYLGVSYGWSF